jgi:hypothetical protein
VRVKSRCKRVGIPLSRQGGRNCATLCCSERLSNRTAVNGTDFQHRENSECARRLDKHRSIANLSSGWRKSCRVLGEGLGWLLIHQSMRDSEQWTNN